MISKELKEAYLSAIVQSSVWPGRLARAYVHAEAMRRKAEWKLGHRCEMEENWGNNPSWTHCADPRHIWTDADWEAEVRRELEEK